MKWLILFLLCLSCLIVSFEAPAEATNNLQPLDAVFQLTKPAKILSQHLSADCSSDARGVRLACDPKWRIRYSPEELVIRISTQPEIDLRVQQSAHRLPAGTQFGREELHALGRYTGWFDLQQYHDCGRQLVLVKGYLRTDPRARAFDYYLIDRHHIYTVQFTTAQAVAFDELQPIFEEIIDSVEFVTENKDTVNFRTPNQRQCQTITRE